MPDKILIQSFPHIVINSLNWESSGEHTGNLLTLPARIRSHSSSTSLPSAPHRGIPLKAECSPTSLSVLSGVPAYFVSPLQAQVLPQKEVFVLRKPPEMFTHRTRGKPGDKKAARQGGKDEASLFEQEQISQTQSTTATRIKCFYSILFTINRSIVILGWTMHAYTLKSLSLTLKVGRIFKKHTMTLPHWLTPLLTGQTSAISAARYQEECFQAAWGHSHTKFFVLEAFW